MIFSCQVLLSIMKTGYACVEFYYPFRICTWVESSWPLHLIGFYTCNSEHAQSYLFNSYTRLVMGMRKGNTVRCRQKPSLALFLETGIALRCPDD